MEAQKHKKPRHGIALGSFVLGIMLTLGGLVALTEEGGAGGVILLIGVPLLAKGSSDMFWPKSDVNIFNRSSRAAQAKVINVRTARLPSFSTNEDEPATFQHQITLQFESIGEDDSRKEIVLETIVKNQEEHFLRVGSGIKVQYATEDPTIAELEFRK